MIHIFENEWTIKSDIVKSNICNILGKNELVDVNLLQLCEFSSEECFKFLENNYIYGGNYYDVNIGLKLNGDVMCSASLNMVGDGIYELTCVCTKNGFTVFNGYESLIKRFIEKNKPQQIVYEHDRKLGKCGWIGMLGFEEVGETRPRLFTIKGDECYLIGCERFTRGIYDCGCVKYVWNNK